MLDGEAAGCRAGYCLWGSRLATQITTQPAPSYVLSHERLRAVMNHMNDLVNEVNDGCRWLISPEDHCRLSRSLNSVVESTGNRRRLRRDIWQPKLHAEILEWVQTFHHFRTRRMNTQL